MNCPSCAAPAVQVWTPDDRGVYHRTLECPACRSVTPVPAWPRTPRAVTSMDPTWLDTALPDCVNP